MQKITIGGDRLGSGKKMKTAINDYERHNANLSYNWASSMTCGVLYPFMCKPILRGEKFVMNLDAAARTIPTKGPLFGSYKLQVDTFFCPVRLYQALLHNNPTALGLRMSDVKLPKLKVTTKWDKTTHKSKLKGAFSNSCLQKYLGMSGIGMGYRQGEDEQNISREYLAIPTLAYYDIAKNYYVNKQEEFGYGITGYETEDSYDTSEPELLYVNTGDILTEYDDSKFIYEENVYKLTGNPKNCYLELGYIAGGTWVLTEIKDSIWNLYTKGYFSKYEVVNGDVEFAIRLTANRNGLVFSYETEYTQPTFTPQTLRIVKFPLSNIDDMRMNILSHHTFGVPYVIDDNADYPYAFNTAILDNGYTANIMPLNGLLLKTYQSDMFNNWLNTEWIDGENGIAEITKVVVSDGSFKLDALNLAEKLYNMLNRVAIAGATYEDWQDVIYTTSPKRHTESPVYLGGCSYEVVFEEIVQSSPADGDPLGTLGGRGTLMGKKGGDIVISAEEAGFVIGIVSLTPRVYYTQQNEWYNTELDSMDDFHKPALDGIGYQNLIGERLAWFDTEQDQNGKLIRHSVGKLPAWIDYNTDFDRAFGDFAELEGKGFMILNRNYEFDGNNDRVSFIKDPTTYVDPSKYNYAFAYRELESQNFWVQIKSNIFARRMGSGKQIPNL